MRHFWHDAKQTAHFSRVPRRYSEFSVSNSSAVVVLLRGERWSFSLSSAPLDSKGGGDDSTFLVRSKDGFCGDPRKRVWNTELRRNYPNYQFYCTKFSKEKVKKWSGIFGAKIQIYIFILLYFLGIWSVNYFDFDDDYCWTRFCH